MIWIITVIVFGLLLYTCRESNLARPLTLSADGVELLPDSDKQAVLQRLPLGYEFLDYRYFAKNELDHINWREKFPRLKLWHDEILFSENKHLRGVQ